MSSISLSDLLADVKDEALRGSLISALTRIFGSMEPDVLLDYLLTGADGWEEGQKSGADALVRLSRRRHGHRGHLSLEMVQPATHLRRLPCG